MTEKASELERDYYLVLSVLEILKREDLVMKA